MMEGVINYTTEGKNKIEILLPLVEGRTSKITKKEEFVMLKKFGINHNEVWNCFTPIDDGKICRKCNNCKERLKILRELGWK
jgi:7-cyano-7-deazaguanine synthase in queuosine biosynthesis